MLKIIIQSKFNRADKYLTPLFYCLVLYYNVLLCAHSIHPLALCSVIVFVLFCFVLFFLFSALYIRYTIVFSIVVCIVVVIVSFRVFTILCSHSETECLFLEGEYATMRLYYFAFLISILCRVCVVSLVTAPYCDLSVSTQLCHCPFRPFLFRSSLFSRT